MNTILNINTCALLFTYYFIPLLFLFYLCKQIIKCNKDIALFMSEKKSKYLLIVYLLFPPVLWYHLSQVVLKVRHKLFHIIIILYLLIWFFALADNLYFYIYYTKIPYGIYFVDVPLFLLFYIIPLLFIVRYFLMKKNKIKITHQFICQ